jgi:hypothetical protein
VFFRRRRIRSLFLVPVVALLLLGVVLSAAAGPDSSFPGAAAPQRSAATAPSAPSEGVAVDAVSIGTGALATTSGTTGFQLLDPAIAGETPAGFRIWVSKYALHHAVIGEYAAATATALRNLGLRIAFLGYATPAPREGIVRIFEGTKGCGTTSTTVGMTWTYWNTLRSGKRYVTRADTYLCPRLFGRGSWAIRATVGHELGHAMGLGHVTYRYLSSYQLMYPAVQRTVLGYRTGDQLGLRMLAAGTAIIRAEIPPVGVLESSSYSNGRILFSGWAKLTWWPSEPVAVELTDNGVAIGVTTTVDTRYAMSVPWNGGDHQFCLVAHGTVHLLARAQIGCVTWRG